MNTIAVCAVGVALIALAVWHPPANADDFGPFYRAAELMSRQQSVYANPTSFPGNPAEKRFLPYIRIPSYAAALRPLAAMPYAVAHRVWIASSALALCACVWLFPVKRNWLAIALAFSFPVANALIVGQDIAFVLLIGLAAARLACGGRECLAGLTASLLCMKLTFVPAAGVAFLAKSRRGTVGFAAGVALQLGFSFGVAGSDWPRQYLALLGNPLLDPDPASMPNLRGLFVGLTLPPAAFVIGALALYTALFFASRRLGLADALIAALPVAVIASPHCRVYDAVVLIPVFVRTASAHGAGLLACFALTPVPYLLLMCAAPAALFAGTASVIIATLVAVAGICRFSGVSLNIPWPNAANGNREL